MVSAESVEKLVGEKLLVASHQFFSVLWGCCDVPVSRTVTALISHSAAVQFCVFVSTEKPSQFVQTNHFLSSQAVCWCDMSDNNS